MTRGTSAGIGMGQHMRMLTAIGIPRTNCRLVEGASKPSSTTAAKSSSSDRDGRVRDPYESKGFWDSLADLFMPDEDRYTYAEGLRRGGYLLTVNVTDAQYDKALDILDDEGTIDIDERTQMWRKEGWSDKDYQSYSHGTSAGRSAATAGQTDYERTTGRKTSAQTGTKGREEAIPIVEEQLRVGKREVGGGRRYILQQVVGLAMDAHRFEVGDVVQ